MTAPVQDKALDASASATTIAVTLDSAIVVGNWLLLAVRRPDTSTVTVADNLGGGTPNVYTSRGYVREAAINRGIELFTCPVTQAGTPTITATYNVSTADRGIAVREASGTYDTSATGTDTGSNPTATLNATATSQPGTCHMFGVLLQGGTPTAGTGFTSAGTTWGAVDVARWQYKEYTATGSQGGNFGNAALDRAVYANFLMIDAAPPAITVQPTDQTAADGGTASFTTTVTGATSYQWETMAPGGGSWGNVSGGTGATSDDYTTATLSRASDAGRFYRLKATNASGDTYSNVVQLRVTQAPTSYDFGGFVIGAGYVGYSVVGALDSAPGVSGTAACTNANDTASASGTTTVVGTSARTTANDTSAASGSPIVNGSASPTAGNDTSTASGTVGSVTGTASPTNANDTSNASGTTTVLGTSARTNADDTSSASGSVGSAVSGSGSPTNQDDTSAASGTTTVTGTAAITAGSDTASASGEAGEAPAETVQPSGGWGRLESYFLGHDRELARLKGEEERERAIEEARAEIARISQEASRQDADRAARELEAVRSRVEAETLAFGDFYRRLLDEAIASIRATEAERIAVEAARLAAIEAERQYVAAAVALLEAEQARRMQDEEEVLLIMATM